MQKPCFPAYDSADSGLTPTWWDFSPVVNFHCRLYGCSVQSHALRSARMWKIPGSQIYHCLDTQKYSAYLSTLKDRIWLPEWRGNWKQSHTQFISWGPGQKKRRKRELPWAMTWASLLILWVIPPWKQLYNTMKFNRGQTWQHQYI